MMRFAAARGTPRSILSEVVALTGQAAAPALACDVALAAATDIPVLISTDAPADAHRIAQTIHGHSEHRDGRFVTRTAAGTAESFEEIFREVVGGTLFITEIANTDAATQAVLVAELDRRAASSPDGTRAPCALRLITATQRYTENGARHAGLPDALYYRLNLIHIVAPRGASFTDYA